jgi:hypothetical protein
MERVLTNTTMPPELIALITVNDPVAGSSPAETVRTPVDRHCKHEIQSHVGARQEACGPSNGRLRLGAYCT